jgi:DNA-directed RNA polymerase subunit RPC12/RpoP
MPQRVCTKCGTRPGRLIEAISQHSRFEYYRCDACNHVWVHFKDNLGASATDTVSRPKPPPQHVD